MATKTQSYSDKLKDPRWQRKRLEILERDDFTCVQCEAKDKPLHVHHGFYRKGFEPWEYPSNTLWTLCEGCHESLGDFRDDIELILGQIRPDCYPHLRDALEEIKDFVNCYGPGTQVDYVEDCVTDANLGSGGTVNEFTQSAIRHELFLHGLLGLDKAR